MAAGGGDWRVDLFERGDRLPIQRQGRRAVCSTRQLAGGALLDVGVYPVALALDCFGGPPRRIQVLAHLGAAGVDERLALQFGYAGGAICSLRCSIRDEMAGAAHLLGERGTITMTAPWWACQRVTLRRDGQDEVVLDFPAAAEGYEYQLEEFARLLREGERESAADAAGGIAGDHGDAGRGAGGDWLAVSV